VDQLKFAFVQLLSQDSQRLRALTTSFNESPAEASRPFDKKREGALKRNATIYAEILGYGLSGYAFHLTSPTEDGMGAKLAMERAVN